jgi:peptide/nickel transport system permease protein
MVLFSALVINFAIPRLMPGNPVDVLTGGAKLTVEARQALITRFGLDAPLWEQFWRYIINAFRGDFGLSFYYFPKPVWDAMMEALPWTLLVILSSLILEVIIGCFLGATAAWKVGTKTDSILQTSSLAIFSAPLFWVAMVLLYVFGFQLGWFPLSGCFTAGATYSSPLEHIADIMKHAALPIITMTIGLYPAYQLILRNTMVSVLKEQYILTAEAKGLSESRIKYRHAARNALLPVLTFLGVSFAISIIGGSVFIETVFSYPGIGKLIYDSVLCRDYPLLQGCFFMFSLVVIVVNFVVDIAYMYIDPRIRY